MLAQIKRETGLIHVSVGNIVSAILGAALWLIIARVLDVASYGTLNYLMAIATLSSAIGLFGVNTLLTIHAGKIPNLKRQAFNFGFISSVGLAAVAFVLTMRWEVAVFVIGEIAFVLTGCAYLGERRYKRFAVLMISQKAVQTAVVIALIVVISSSYSSSNNNSRIDGILLGYGVSAAAFGIPVFASLAKFSFSFTEIRTKLKLSFHSYSMEMARIVAVWSDKIIITPLFGYVILGNYQIGSQFLVFLGTIPLILYNYLLPQLSHGSKNAFVEVFAVGFAALLALAFVLTVPWLIGTFFAKYAEAIPTVQVMVLGIIPWSVTSVVTSKLLAAEQSTPVLLASAIFIVTQYVLIVTLGNAFGLWGLGLATLLAFTIESAFLILAHRHVCRNTTMVVGTAEEKRKGKEGEEEREE